MRLTRLALVAQGRLVGADTEVSGISADSRETQPGELFVAIPGFTHDGSRFIPAALERGAVAVCARAPHPGTPTLVVDDPRRALALLAAEAHGHPARDLRLIGITGSLGKTSTALMLEQALGRGGQCTGVIGSLGVRFRDDVVYTRMTTPEAPAIHSALAQMREDGAQSVVMEVTSHSLRLERVAGLELSLGVFTNLVPDEHLEFHPTPQDYLDTKARFLDMLRPGAPLVANADDEHIRRMLSEREQAAVLVSFRDDPQAPVWVRDVRTGGTGSEFTLRLREPLRTLGGGTIAPTALDMHLALLGAQQVANGSLAAVAALLAGVRTDALLDAMAEARPIHRRMQVLHDADPMIIDDTVGNAVSIHRLFDVVEHIPHRRLHVVYAVRGTRGENINAGNAAALAQRLRASRTQYSLIITASEDMAGPRDQVSDAERMATRNRLESDGVDYEFEPELEPAVRGALARAGDGDLVLLLGAQGMDAAGNIVREVLGLERRAADRV